MKSKTIQLLPLILLLSVGQIWAQKDEKIKNINVPQLIGDIGSLLQERYLFVDTANKMNDFLQSRLEQDAFGAVETARELARVITNELQENFHDRHLQLMYAPVLAQMIKEGIPEEPSQAEIDQELAIEVYENFRLPELRRLEGNIGYLRIDQFLPPKYARGYAEKMSACFEFIGDTDGLIIDLRYNPGGYGDGVGFFLSHLLPPSTKIAEEISRIPSGGMDTAEGYTLDKLEARTYLDKPIYVLVSGQTASAAEAVAHVLKYSNRATVVGQQTYGAGYLGDDFAIDEQFVMTISYAMGKHPNAPSNWEGVGVEPDIKVDYENTMEMAMVGLLKKVLENEKNKSKADQSEKKIQQLEWELKRMEDLRHPIVISAEQMKAYEGNFGSRQIQLKEGKLYYRRINPDRPAYPLIPVGTDEFLIDGLNAYRLLFMRDKKTGVITSLKMRSVTRLFIDQKNSK